MRFAILVFFTTLLHSAAFAGDNTYIINFDLNTLSPSGEIDGSIQLQGIHLLPEKSFHGEDFGKFDYFLTVSKVKNEKVTLTVEFYEYESRKKKSDVESEVVAEFDVALGIPVRFEGKSDTFGVDLALSVDRR